MIKVGDVVRPNIILMRSLRDNPNLPFRLKNTLRLLDLVNKNFAEVASIDTRDGYEVCLKPKDSYNSPPAVMCEGYNGGQGVKCWFENEQMADLLLHDDKQISLVNLSPKSLPGETLVRLVYNNGNLVVIPAIIGQLEDYHGVIGKVAQLTHPYQPTFINLYEISQLLDNHSFHKLTVRGF
jgi:hypothetical protein